jgi:hypothetical protein
MAKMGCVTRRIFGEIDIAGIQAIGEISESVAIRRPPSLNKNTIQGRRTG